ncbi:uncharacterized protein LOC123555101 isoform X2 [Mercenaria mercenaria]|uniref:uncharacterized protein LOC123555101 isoform X2 n=1 Tax=Mercenaria mercenaria TaxID=6596 RepID=UPI00234EB1D2|nr:uncharacterized protein LOC123555101 isoform X2 [Mercenaria mercenaria]
METDCLKIILALAFLVEVHTIATDFNYTACKWYNSKCIQVDRKEFADNVTSEWPPGPYALITPIDGCPESSVRGWRRGYLSFTWRRPHTLTSVTDCDLNHKGCIRNLIPDTWPELQSNLLGPYSKYALRLNFCFKTGNKSVIDDKPLWPAGSYSVFGDGKSCPAGLKSSERKIRLPSITEWTSNGHLPGFSVITEDTDSSITLLLQTCEQQAIENDAREFFPMGSFIFTKNKENATCPHLPNKHMETESIQLHTEVNESVEISQLFIICFYRPNTLTNDFSQELGRYLYTPPSALHFPGNPAFTIFNPTLTYGEKISTRIADLQHKDMITLSTLPHDSHYTTTPWLLVDLGRNIIVLGLQFTNYSLKEVESVGYLGELNKTVNGYICQRWDAQTPHRHNYTSDWKYEKNFCRDPDSSGKIWCFSQSLSLRWEICAENVFEFREKVGPFSKCFISEDRWRIDEFGGISCQYTVSHNDGSLNINFQRDLEGRYVKLVSHEGIESSKFYSSAKNVHVLTSEQIAYADSMCNIDLGMGDERIHDHQISASSWLPQFLPTSGRPFSSGWCADPSDMQPYIAVDLEKDTTIEGITFFNWGLLNEYISDGKYKKTYMHFGSSKLLVHYRNRQNNTYTNKTYSLDMFLPIDIPQTFHHNPIRARYIKIYITEAIAENYKCLRFELHGCKQRDEIALPELVSTKWNLEQSKDESIMLNNVLQILNEACEISNIAYPAHYLGGFSYTWIIDFPEGRYIQLVFTEMSLRRYETRVWNQCQDKLVFSKTIKDASLYIDERFNGLVSRIETDLTYMILTFSLCIPTSKIERVGNGFKASVMSKAIPTCFAARRQTNNTVHTDCFQPSMYITSRSVLNFPAANVHEKWSIHVKRCSIHLKVIYFNVDCDSGHLLTIIDRFSGNSKYCHSKRPPADWYSDSDTIDIVFEKGSIWGSKEGFKALYRTHNKSITNLILSNKYAKDSASKNAEQSTYQGCSGIFGKCYNIYSGKARSWNKARQECWKRHSRLVAIHSDDELELIKYMLRNFRDVNIENDTQETAFPFDNPDPNYFTHIGLARTSIEAGFNLHLWEDGSPVTFSAWKEGEPSATNSDCTRMSFHLFHTNNTWEAENCENGLASYFICEHNFMDAEINSSKYRCYTTHSAYLGHWNKTWSGKVCQSWNSQFPHDHEAFLDSQFPDGSVVNAVNYCRDPYNEGYLWCFTMDNVTILEHCIFDYRYQLSNFTSDIIHSKNTFRCKNGVTISHKYLCNGKPDCLDLSDEINCTRNEHQLMLKRAFPADIMDRNNTYSLFHCESKEWVSMLARCDRVIDCSDASDEINCSLNKKHAMCTKGEYSCGDGSCIHISQMCDFIVDCIDASDETCVFQSCSTTEYRCQNQQCIPNENRCDAYVNCQDGTDEENCDADECKGNSFHCDNVRCIPRRLVCDRYVDCTDESDEMLCVNVTHYSCEEWWNAGYRKNGIYTLESTEVECNFDAVNKYGLVHTVFRNFKEYTYRMPDFGWSMTMTTVLNNLKIIDTHFHNESYSCFQNITKSCIPDYEAISDVASWYREHNCTCITRTVVPYKDSHFNSTLQFCDARRLLDGNIGITVFTSSSSTGNIIRAFTYDAENVTFGPVVCSNVEKLESTNVGCGEENKVFPESVRCVFDIDSYGLIIGCRSGQHLQGCENFTCPKNTVKCPGSYCVPLKFICDGQIQCPGGQDEKECGCQDDDREVLLLYNDTISRDEKQKILKIAAQFYTTNSIVRELRYKAKFRPDRPEFNHLMLDISDTVVNPYSTTNRGIICNYSVLASDFVNSIKFSKTKSRGILYFQKYNESDSLDGMMFENIRSTPEFLIYRIIQLPFDEMFNLKTYPVITDIVIKSLATLVAVGSKYFPALCKEAAMIYCPNEYKCAGSKTCIPLVQICDGQAQCLHGDDERYCEYSCPENCTCLEYTTNCSFADVDCNTLPYVHRNSRLLELSGNTRLRDILVKPMLSFPYLVSLNISMCGIEDITAYAFKALANLRIMDLSFNNLMRIPSFAFSGLRKLKMLNLLGNRDIHIFEPNSMTGLSSIRNIEISGANIHKISSNTFADLDLDELKLPDNNIHEMEDNVFSGMNVKIIDMENTKITIFNKGLFHGASGITSLHTPAFKYCCVRPNYLADADCFPEKDEFSSCADLLRVSALQTMLWLIGIFALFGNILSVIYRLVYDRERLKLGFGIFVTNLAVADFLMGIYLIIIAVADAAYRKRYIFMDDYWRNSIWCTLAGFLSTVSSEASVFFLCLITLDRILVTKYPFGQIRFNTKTAGKCSGIVWMLSVSVGLIPIVYEDYFQDKFYSRSGICIALPLTRDRPPGWLYSIIIFVGLNFVTFCLIAIGQVIIYSEIKKATSGIRRTTRQDKDGSARRRELTVARNLLLVVTTDFLCWFPIGCMGTMALSGHVIPGEVYAWTAVFILPVNSALNPVLYTLTAILGKKKEHARQDALQCIPINSPRRVKTTLPFIRLFRYGLTKADGLSKTFVSLDALRKQDINLTSKDVLKIAQNLSRCLYLLHTNSLMVKLDGNVVFVSVEDGKVTGDVQIRQEPTECSTDEMKRDNMSQLGQVVRCLLVILQKNKRGKCA